MASRIVADLHLHSTASDGELSPAQLIQAAIAARLEACALTDHDTLSGLAEAARCASAAGIRLIPGVELSAYNDSEEIHLLGLFIEQTPDSPVATLIHQMQQGRPERLFQMFDRLRALGVPLDRQDLDRELVGSDSPGRAHLAAALVKRGLVADTNQAFQKFLRPGAPAYIPKIQGGPAEVIRAVHQSGGLAILAHPAQYRGEQTLTGAIQAGIDGIEIDHHSTPPELARRLTELARHQKLLITGGSDYHGPNRKPGIEVGSRGIASEQFAALLERAEALN